MKKQLFISLLFLNSVFLINAQWNGTNPLWTDSNVGIGTSNPQAKLEVSENMIVQDYVYMYGANNTGVIRNTLNAGSMIFSGGNSTSDGANIRLGGSMGNNDLRIRIGTSEKFRITSTGKVGVGVDDPQAKLEVSGDMIVQDNITIQDYVYMYGANNTGVIRNTLNSGGMVFSGGNSTGDGANICLGGSMGNNNLRIRIGTSEKFRITSTGKVGIGTEDPQSLLAVNGTITSKEVKVTLDGWSDFVFNNDYQLKDLEEVETFINKNNRLPGIPSEAEVVENGVNLGEMDTKLLQKIEELTLYMITINKEVKSLKKENFELKEKIEKLESEK